MPNPDALARDFAAVALEAGRSILEVYHSPITATAKADGSPVTAADTRAEATILRRLAALVPGVPVLSEEAASAGQIPDLSGTSFIAVDPLDGTKEFISRNGEFTVNIALIEHGTPIAGVVYAPALGILFAAGRHSWRAKVAADVANVEGMLAPIRTRRYPTEGLTAVVSRSHLDPKTTAFLTTVPIADRRDAGSSLKFCRIAAGEADVYPRFGPTMEWDTAAGHAVLLAAGGCVLGLDGRPLCYGKCKQGFRNSGFIAWGQGPLTQAEQA